MDKTMAIVCAVVGSLGLLSAIFGFSAEGTKLTPYDIEFDMFDDECIYPENPALGLGICGVIFLLAAQVTFTAVGGCCGCCNTSRFKSSETKRIIGIVCAVLSWIAAVIAFVLFIEGAAWNAHVVRVTQAPPYCPYLKDGIFAGAGVLSLAATALGVTSYVLIRPPQVKATAAPPAAVPAGGKPELPPAAADTQGNNGSPLDQEAQHPSADTTPPAPPPAMASAPPQPAGDQPSAAGAEIGQQLPVQLPQASVQQQGSEDVIRTELTKAGIRLGERVVEHILFS